MSNEKHLVYTDSDLVVEGENRDGVQIYYLDGRINSVNSDVLETIFTTNPMTVPVILEMMGVTYLSSSGMREMMSGQRKAQKNNTEVILVNPSDRAQEVLELAGLITLFKSFNTVDDALHVVK